MSAPVVALPIWDQPFVLTTDWDGGMDEGRGGNGVGVWWIGGRRRAGGGGELQ